MNSFGYYYNFNNPNNPYYSYNQNFRAQNKLAQKPVSTKQEEPSGAIDNLINTINKEKEKKSNKKAIAAGVGAASLIALVTVLNPKYSTKLISKFKSWQQTLGKKVNQNSKNFFKGNFYKIGKKGVDWTLKGLEFTNNFNSGKDILFKWLCTDGNKKITLRNHKFLEGILKKIDKGFVWLMKKPHEATTKWFDKISRSTVKAYYEKAGKEMTALDGLINQYCAKLPVAEKQKVQRLLRQIAIDKTYLSTSNVERRLIAQEGLMANLERDFMKFWRGYKNGFSNKWIDKGQHIGKNMRFWAQDIMMPQRNIVEQQGQEAIQRFVGDGKGKKGAYDEIFDILKKHLSSEEKTTLESAITRTSKKLKKASHGECIEYFDKKRDLVLGSAPTDILTAGLGLTIGGVALATADSKEEKRSRALTGVFPVIAGFGVSMAMTAMLFSGVQGLLLGGLASVILSKLGNTIDKKVFGTDHDLIAAQKHNHHKYRQKQEVIYA